MMLYRAKTKDGKEVEGGLIKYNGKRYIFENNNKPFVARFIKIDPATLALDTTIKDKHGKAIFGSVPVDGVMSKGGDRIKHRLDIVYDVKWHEGEFMAMHKLCKISLWRRNESSEIIESKDKP